MKQAYRKAHAPKLEMSEKKEVKHSYKELTEKKSGGSAHGDASAVRLDKRSRKAKGGAWTRKEGQNPEGGLNAKGRASANAEGHNLKPPAPHPKTDKDAARRKSFCARMKGMKEHNTSAETAKDPDSRINKSLRVWNCHSEGGKVWDKSRPKDLGKSEPLSSSQKSSAKARAKAAGRKWPNLIDNMNASKKKS